MVVQGHLVDVAAAPAVVVDDRHPVAGFQQLLGLHAAGAVSYTHLNQRKLLRDYYEQHTELREYEVIEFCDDGIPAQILTDHNSCL